MTREQTSSPSLRAMRAALEMFGWKRRHRPKEPTRWVDPLGMVEWPMRTADAYELLVRRIRNVVVPPEKIAEAKKRIAAKYSKRIRQQLVFIGGAQ